MIKIMSMCYFTGNSWAIIGNHNGSNTGFNIFFVCIGLNNKST